MIAIDNNGKVIEVLEKYEFETPSVKFIVLRTKDEHILLRTFDVGEFLQEYHNKLYVLGEEKYILVDKNDCFEKLYEKAEYSANLVRKMLSKETKG